MACRLHFGLLIVTATVVASCGVGSTSAASPPFVVATGEDGAILLGDGWAEPVQGFTVRPYLRGGATIVPVDDESASVLGDEEIAVVTAHAPARRAECFDCSGLAVDEGELITTRKNYSPTGGFDIVTFSGDLQVMSSVPAERLPERAANEFPAENIDSPVALAADADSVTVGYLSRNGGIRRGPSLVARYDRSGELRGTLTVDGLIGRSAVSPDGRYLGLDVMGSGGACITSSKPVVIDLEQFTAQPVGPEVPSDVRTNDPLQPPWFTLTDMVWDGERLLIVGEANAPDVQEESGCDRDPALFERRVNPATGRTEDSPTSTLGIRWTGPGCTVAAVSGSSGEPELYRFADGDTTLLGQFQAFGPGPVARDDCAAA